MPSVARRPNGPANSVERDPRPLRLVIRHVPLKTIRESVPNPAGCHNVWKMSRNAYRITTTPAAVVAQVIEGPYPPQGQALSDAGSDGGSGSTEG